MRDLIRDTAERPRAGPGARCRSTTAASRTSSPTPTPTPIDRPCRRRRPVEVPDDRPLGRDACGRQRHPRPGLPALHGPAARSGSDRPRPDPHRVPQRLRSGPLGQVQGAALRPARPQPPAGRHRRRGAGLRAGSTSCRSATRSTRRPPRCSSASSWRRRPRCCSRATCGTAPSRSTSRDRCGRAPTRWRGGPRCSARPWCSCCCRSSSSTPSRCSVSSTSASRPARPASRWGSRCCWPCSLAGRRRARRVVVDPPRVRRGGHDRPAGHRQRHRHRHPGHLERGGPPRGRRGRRAVLARTRSTAA